MALNGTSFIIEEQLPLIRSLKYALGLSSA